MELTVKTFAHAKAIARAFTGAGNALAAQTYLDKFELRRSIEIAARDNLFTVR